jgi:probable HAF family extracellular repeat protein
MHELTLGARGKEASIAVDINAHGQMAGIIEEEDGRQRAILYDRRPRELGTLGGSDSFTRGLNAGGDVVGTAQNSAGYWRAFVVRHGERMRDVGTLGGNSSYGAAINDSGQVAGFSDTSDGYYRAFVTAAQSDSAARDLGTLGGRISYAAGINNQGVVVGTAALADGYRHAFLSQPGGAMQDLGTLGGRSSSASAINDNSVVVGASETAGRRWHAFLWNKGRMVDLGALIGYGDSYATAVNQAGHVVGSIRIGDERRSFVYRDGKMTVHRGGYGLYLVNAINNQELVIGARYIGKKFTAATMISSQPAVVTHGAQDFLGAIVLVLTVATGVILYRRRYHGIALRTEIS